MMEESPASTSSTLPLSPPASPVSSSALADRAFDTDHVKREFVSESRAQSVVDAIVKRWKDGDDPDALAALAEAPEMARCKSTVLDLAYEEYCLRRERGERINSVEFCRRFGSYECSVWRQIEVYHALPQEQADWPQLGELRMGVKICGVLGEGGFGRVYLAEDESIGRLLAVKFCVGGRFEAATLARLNHPNIVPVYSHGEDGHSGMSTISMPYWGRVTAVDALDLFDAERAFQPGGSPIRLAVATRSAHAEDARTEESHGAAQDPAAPRFVDETTPVDYVDDVIRVGRRLASALAHAHQRGVQHRDLKPSNILINDRAEPLLLDFNLAESPVVEGQRAGGTLEYMSPEQIQAFVLDPVSGATLDARTDVFSLGVVLFQLLCGKSPFKSEPSDPFEDRAAAVYEQQQQGPPLDLLPPAVPQGLKKVLAAALAFDPAKRPTAAHMERAFGDLQRPLVVARRWARRHRRLVGAGALSLLLLVLVVAGALARLPARHVSHLRWAVGLFQQGKLAEAREHTEEALASRPNWAEALLMAGLIEIEFGNPAAAEAMFKRAITNDGDQKYRFALAYARNKLKLHESATLVYQELAEQGFQPEASVNLGRSWLQLGKVEKAIQCLDEVCRRYPDYQPGLYNRTCADLMAAQGAGGPPELGLQIIERTIRAGEVSGQMHLDLACALAWAAKYDDRLEERVVEHLNAAIEAGATQKELKNALPEKYLARVPLTNAATGKRKLLDQWAFEAPRLIKPELPSP